jgi:hypothetical protein
MYASLLEISGALHLDVFEQPEQKGVFGQDSFFEKPSSPGHREEIYSFVYREMPAKRQAGMPIDEKNLSNQNNETVFFMDLLAQIDDQ